MQNSMVIFVSSVSNRKLHIWENLVQKFTVFCLNWNLVPFGYAEFDDDAYFSLLWTRNPFFAKTIAMIKVIQSFCWSCLFWFCPVFVLANWSKFLKMLQLCRASYGSPSILVTETQSNWLFVTVFRDYNDETVAHNW